MGVATLKKNRFRTINETFTVEEHARLKKAKGKKTWHDFILTLANGEKP